MNIINTKQVVKNAHQADYADIATISNAVKNVIQIWYAKQVMNHITMIVQPLETKHMMGFVHFVLLIYFQIMQKQLKQDVQNN